MKKFLTIIILGFSASLALSGSQDVSEAMHVIDLNAPLPPVDPRSVEVYTYKPAGNVKLVGKIFARGMATVDRPGSLDILGILSEGTNPSVVTEEDDKRLAMDALLKDAGNIGANAVVITKSYQVEVSNRSTERRIEALAFLVVPEGVAATEVGQIRCQMSLQCSSGYACRARNCVPEPLFSGKFPPLESVSVGGACFGDEHCQSNLYCSPRTGTCTRRY